MSDDQAMEEWVDSAPEGQKEFRQAVHVIITAVSTEAQLREKMVMKGGILMGIRYHSPRYTTDIDFSSNLSLTEVSPVMIEEALNASLLRSAAGLGYDLDCRVQGCRVNPPRPDATFPSIELKIGYAYKGTPKHRRLEQRQSPSVISIDFSLNERILETEDLQVDGGSLTVYGPNEIMAEKIRSLLQQVPRNRFRRQDVFDLNLLLIHWRDFLDPSLILESLMVKARSRGIEIRPESLSDPEVKRRAQIEYLTLTDEIEGDLPDFDRSYDRLVEFYKALPWSSSGLI